MVAQVMGSYCLPPLRLAVTSIAMLLHGHLINVLVRECVISFFNTLCDHYARDTIEGLLCLMSLYGWLRRLLS